MSNMRLALAAVVSFCVAFVVMSYGMPLASKGVNARPSVATIEPFAEMPAAMPAAAAASLPAVNVAAAEHKVQAADAPAKAVKPPAPAAAAAPAETGRDRLAQTALQAAQSYAVAPCDRMAKTAFIVAASTYLRAQDASSKAPKDARVHDAIKTAFETGNVSLNDFPLDVVMVSGFTATPSRASCINSAGLRR